MADEALFSIGEFSRITGLTVKALRFYHEERVLLPAAVDAGTGYRYYRAEQVELARVIALLRNLDMPLKDIRTIVTQPDRARMKETLRRHQAALQEQIRKHKEAVRKLEDFLAAERTGAPMAESVQEKTLAPMLVAGIRTRGRYSDCGKLFGQICRGARSAAGGPPLMLYYDAEYKESDADFEACVPLKKAREVAGASVRELPGGKCLSLIHNGPYEELHRSYQAMFQYLKQHNLRVKCPSREVYIKGPGMIFRGNPKKYITEIQMLLEDAV